VGVAKILGYCIKEMLSRVAESIYWLNRYLERADNNARFLDVNFNLALELSNTIKEQWQPLLVAAGSWKLFQDLHNTPTRDKVIYFIGFDPENPSSIYSSIAKARENARTIRENLSSDYWEQINTLYHKSQTGTTAGKLKNKDPRKFFLEIRRGCLLLNGIAYTTMARTEGWHFGQTGMYLERADNTSRILDVKYHILLPSVDSVGSPVDLVHWAALLKSVNGYTQYRRGHGKINPAAIVDFLVLDRSFPRSILHCLVQSEFLLHQISGGSQSGFKNLAEKKMGALRSEIEYADVHDLFQTGLHEYLDVFQVKVNSISESIGRSYFSIKD